MASGLEQHQGRWTGCTKCSIGCRAHKHVFNRGATPCDVLVVGEAPGMAENLFGEAFIGREGRLLERLLKLALPKGRTYAMTNLLACRPCDKVGALNRPAHADEVINCRPRLIEFVETVAKPAAVVLLGDQVKKHYYQEDVRPQLLLPPVGWIIRQGGVGSQTFDECAKRLWTFLNEQHFHPEKGSR